MVFQRQASVMKSDWEAQEKAKVPCGVWGGCSVFLSLHGATCSRVLRRELWVPMCVPALRFMRLATWSCVKNAHSLGTPQRKCHQATLALCFHSASLLSGVDEL